MADYSKLKVAELKDLIKERGIASSGLKLKQQFIEALEADDESKRELEQTDAQESRRSPSATPEATDDLTIDTTPQQESEKPNVNAPNTEDAPSTDALLSTKTGPVETSTHRMLPEKNGNSAAITTDVEGASSDSEMRKRKRRSPTPPVSTDTVNKKLKAADEEPVKLPEDVMDMSPPIAEVPKEQAPISSSGNAMEVDEDMLDASDEATQPAQHPATRALYIRELVRPLQPAMLRRHIESLACRPGDMSDSAAIESFYLDRMKSHAFVEFKSVNEAVRTRSALHGKVWPAEPMRRPLWVDFVPEEKVSEWIATETNQTEMVRWEVVYAKSDPDSYEQVSTTLQEVQSGPPRNAPSGPRRRSSSHQQQPTVNISDVEEPPPGKAFDSLEDRYQHTTTKPKLYYQPVPKELAERRLAELSRAMSRNWDERNAHPEDFAEREMHRYTFENGDRIVDSGQDVGMFGRGSGGGRGRGGPPRGGGFRGGRYHDFYRGGGPRR